MTINDLEGKLKLKCKFNDLDKTIKGRIIYQCPSVVYSDQDYFSNGSFFIRSRSYPELDNNFLYLRGRDKSLDNTEFFYGYYDLTSYQMAKRVLSLFIRSSWKVGYV